MPRRPPELRMRSQLVAPLLALVRARGGDPAALARRFDLPATVADEPEVVLPLATLHALLDAAAEEARDPFLGVHLAERLPRGAYGVVEYTCRTAPTIRAALGRIARYVGLLNELVTVTVEEREGGAVIEHRVPGQPLAVGRHGNEFFVVMLLSGARTLAASRFAPTRVAFAHPAPPDVSALVEALGTRRLEFGAGANRIELPASALDLPLTTHDPALLALLDRQAEQALAGLPSAGRLATLVKRRIGDTLGDEPATLEGMAAALRMSPRTLQRRLGDEGVKFADLLDEARRERALDYVRDRRRPLGEIAYLLGYAELSPFLRAFKRWTGKTPGEVRG